MRVLLDECLPKRLSGQLTGHDTTTTQSRRWSGLANGVLLARAAAEGFEVFITVDRGIRHQQELPKGLALLTLRTRSNAFQALKPMIPSILAALRDIQPGDRATIDSL